MELNNIISKIKNLTQSFRKVVPHGKKIFGFDLGSYSIKIAEIALEKDQIVFKSFLQGRTYKGVLINGIIGDFQQLLNNLSHIISTIPYFPEEISLALPYDLLIFDYFKIENLPDDAEIKEKINQEIPYKIEDVYYSYYIVPEKEDYKIFFLVVKKEVVESYLKLFESVNCKIKSIDGDFINLHNLCEYLQYKKTKVIIDWGYSKIKILFSDKEYPIYGRELFNLGLQRLEKEIMKELGVTLDAAQEMIVNPERAEGYTGFKEVYLEYISEVISEIRDTIFFIGDKFDVHPEIIIIVGGGGRIPGICELMTELLKIKTQTLKIEEKIKVSENIDPSYLSVINTQGAIAVATALREFL